MRECGNAPDIVTVLEIENWLRVSCNGSTCLFAGVKCRFLTPDGARLLAPLIRRSAAPAILVRFAQ